MTTTELQLKNTLQHLLFAKAEIRGTTLITYILTGLTDSWLIGKHITSEIAESVNIKCKQVRNTVIENLKKIESNYEKYCSKGKTPKNGLVCIVGKIDNPNYEEMPYYV